MGGYLTKSFLRRGAPFGFLLYRRTRYENNLRGNPCSGVRGYQGVSTVISGG
ncbi:Uncharacterised protein [uncultured Clostridium sp.]|nr:Uncharacterised protein [uncultured Clostridium sp.]